jgi:TPR repeat protein
VRDEGHDWRRDCEKCSRCGTARPTAHKWTGCKCSVCGKTRDEGHDWSEDSEKCSRCGTAWATAHKELITQLLQAVGRGDVEEIRKALVAGATPNKIVANIGDLREVTLLHLAAAGGHADVVEVLLAAGAGKDPRDGHGMTPLHLAANVGCDEIVRLLVAAGADAEARENRQGLRPIHFAAIMGHDAVIATLLEAKADKNGLDAEGSSPLHCAANAGHSGVVKRLLNAGADRTLRLKGQTPLDLALQKGHLAVADLLAGKATEMSAPQTPLERERELALDVETLLLRLNPMGINPCRDNEYFPEARQIAPLIPNCKSEQDVVNAVHEVFIRFFSAPYEAGPASRYAKAGHEIWELWLKYKGVKPQDESPHITTLRQRATAGDLEALFDLGAALCNGDGVLRDIKEGYAHIEKAAERGFVRAQFALAELYEKAFIPGGVTKAIEWYEKAANQGDKEAQYVLGYLYTRPVLGRNFAIAAQWLEKAALQGQVAAQRDLGLMYSRGDGVAKDLAKARHWLQEAAVQGNQEAQHFLQNL